MQQTAPVVFPVSAAQRGIWLADRLDPGSTAYHFAVGVRLTGRLDHAALARAAAGLVDRHEALRTTFAQIDHELVQLMHAASDVRIRPVQFDAGFDGDPVGLDALLRQEARIPFDLENGPLLRLLLIRDGTAEDRHILMVTVHHLVFDMWSCGIFLNDLAALYAADATGLPVLGLQFGDFAVWESGVDWRGELDFWRGELGGAGGLGLPWGGGGAGGVVPVRLPGAVAGGVGDVCARFGVTPFVVLSAVYALVLGRFSGRGDVVFGSTVGVRRAELEPVVGCLVNTVGLRVGLGGGVSFGGLLGRVRSVVLRAFEHADAPFDRVVEACGGRPGVAGGDLVQAHFVLQDAPFPRLSLPDLTAEAFPVDRGAAQFDLNLHVRDAPDGGYEGFLEFRPGVLDEVVARGLVECFGHVLDVVLADPGVLVDELDVPPLPAVGTRASAGDALVRRVCELYAEVLHVPSAGPHDSFFEFGGDSIDVAVLTGRAHRAGIPIAATDVFEGRTPAGVAARAADAAAAARSAGPAPNEAVELGTGEVRPSPIMHWLREAGGPVARLAQTVAVRTPVGLAAPTLAAALRDVVNRHEMLRSRLRYEPGGWRIEIGDPVTDPGTLLDVAASGGREGDDEIAAYASRAGESLDPAGGRVMRAVFLDAGAAQPGVLVLAVSRLAIDGVSWRILLDDLATACAAGPGTVPDPRGRAPTSFRRWSEALAARAGTAEVRAELPYWRQVLEPASTPVAGGHALPRATSRRPRSHWRPCSPPPSCRHWTSWRARSTWMRGRRC